MEKKFYALRPVQLTDRELTLLSDLCKKQKYSLDLTDPVPVIRKNGRIVQIQRDHGQLFATAEIESNQVYQNLSEILQFSEWMDRAIDTTTHNLHKRGNVYRAARMLFHKTEHEVLSIIYLDT